MEPAPLKPRIAYDVFAQLDIRVGTIVEVSDVEGSSKLLRLRVDFGDGVRTILSGMKKERPDAQALVGVQTLFVVNLEPRRMAGEVSDGMLFDLGHADGVTPRLAIPEGPIPNGARAG